MKVIVEKFDPYGAFVWRYDGILVEQTPTLVVMEARFKRDIVTEHFHYQMDDRMVEYYYSDRGYNIFAIFDRDSDLLRGFYCNITHPAEFVSQNDALVVRYRDLYLDVFVYPDGKHILLDEDELAEADLPADTLGEVWASVAALLALLQARSAPFE
jgi:predicted RNA-binding protein associated with RNAse of E/G family